METLQDNATRRPHNRSDQLKPAFYREADLVQRLLPFSSSTLWRMVRRGDFPAPVKLSPKVTAWPARVVQHWIRAREEGAQ